MDIVACIYQQKRGCGQGVEGGGGGEFVETKARRARGISGTQAEGMLEIVPVVLLCRELDEQ